MFWNNKASSKYIYTLNGVHIWVFFNTESLNERAPHFKLGYHLRGFGPRGWENNIQWLVRG